MEHAPTRPETETHDGAIPRSIQGTTRQRHRAGRRRRRCHPHERASAITDLLARGVRALEIWPVPHPLLDRNRFAELEPARRQLLALPVHQLLRDEHVDHIRRMATEVLRP